MMKAIFYTSQSQYIERIYSASTVKRLSENYEFLTREIVSRKNIDSHTPLLKDVEAIFTTWGMESFEIEEIKRYFPSLRYIFYGAGSVQHFAKQFLECGVRIFSANVANSIPVAEYVTAQIILANKGVFQAANRAKRNRYFAHRYSDNCVGNYRPKIGIIGVGQIGRRVVESLKKNIDAEIYYYDPFLPDDVATSLGIQSISLEAMFLLCDVISNHLADKDELEGILSYSHFSVMKPYATFINSARGRQVDEKGLVKAMRECKTRTALLDVTYPEPCGIFSPLRFTGNIILTPHIAGSLGGELARMGEYMLSSASAVASGDNAPYEVTADMLKTMA